MTDSPVRRPGPGFLAPIGALVAGACFFLPYVRLLRVFGAAVTLPGPRIGGALWLVPATAAAILLVHFGVLPIGSRRLRAGLVALAAAFGLLLMAGVVLRIHHRTGFLGIHISAATFGVRPAEGWVGSLAGFLLAFTAAVRDVTRRRGGAPAA